MHSGITAPATLDGWLDYLETLHPAAIEMGLERVRQVKEAAALEPGFPVITVGGTNGKGSTCAMLEGILQAAGYRVGVYTSPHLIRYNERVRINGVEASDADLVASFAFVEASRGEVPLTYFEFGTLAAMRYFMTAGVDVAVLEVGLGGRLDAVNIFDPACAILTSVDLDHQEYLGTTREAIGREKAGIFRAGRRAVYGEADIPGTVRAHAAEIGAELWVLGEDFSIERQESQWCLRMREKSRASLPYPALRGSYQLHNAACALVALDALADRFSVSQNDIRRGLLEATVTGRFQVLPGRPLRIFDVAHNPHAARGLAANLRQIPPSGRALGVFAMLADKDMNSVVSIMQDQIDLWLVASISNSRGASAETLAGLIRTHNPKAHVLQFGTPGEAYEYACKMATENDRIITFGSFHTVSECLDRQVLPDQ